MHMPSMQHSWWFAFWASTVHAQFLVEKLSFGHQDVISPNLRGIPEWYIQGEPTPPQLLRDRIILTPPAVGNRRAAIWSENRMNSPEWEFTTEFRASGPDRGGGNLQVWYTKDGRLGAGTSSVYTVGRFDGLVLAVDQYGGSAGMIRGFLNDGAQDFSNSHNVDSLAFGHCTYAYRNLGRLSKLTIRQTKTAFIVDIDGKQCFSTNEIQLPSDNYLGISAGSAETPDSFEVFKFLTTTPTPITIDPANSGTMREQQDTQFSNQQPIAPAGTPPEAPASQYRTSEAQFEDLHNRIQALTAQLSVLHSAVLAFTQVGEQRHIELLQRARVPHDQLNAMEARQQAIERSVIQLQRDIEGKDYKNHLMDIKDAMKESHSSLMTSLPESMGQIVATSAPRMGMFLFWVVVVQLLLAASYVIYKRRRANAPKKYL